MVRTIYQVAGVRCLVLILLILSGCSNVAQERVFRNGCVVASEAEAARIGLRALQDGGNAIDAAVATALALAVTYPEAGNIGGGGFALVYLAEEDTVMYLDFRETAPSAASPDLYMIDSLRVDQQKSQMGASAAGVPGTVAGLYELHDRFGALEWSAVVAPARSLADTGIVVTDNLRQSLLEHRDKLLEFESTSEMLFPGGHSPEVGEKLFLSDLAATLTAIELDGRDGFYTGEVAEEIAEYCAANGGYITLEDMAMYQPIWRDPVSVQFRGLDVYCAGLPSSGGIVMGQILLMLDRYELERYTTGSPQYMHLFAEAARRAYADRAEYLGDPAYTEDYTRSLLEEEYISARLSSLDMDNASSSDEVLPGLPRGRTESDQTTHLVTADRNGNIVSLTYTINASYGSGAVVEGAGFLLNNEMDDFAIAPGVPNMYGLVGGEANQIEAGKRMLSSMSPTIVFDDGKPYLALGSPGGSKIITAVAQTIINHRVFNLTVGEAVAEPRFHHQWHPDVIRVEEAGFEPAVIAKLKLMGHQVDPREPYSEVMAIGFSRDGLFKTGAADPRGHGVAVGY